MLGGGVVQVVVRGELELARVIQKLMGEAEVQGGG